MIATRVFARRCQECGHLQLGKPGAVGVKCRKCKSDALDYGSYAFTQDETGAISRVEYEESDDGCDS